jgi:DNA polymerase-3 subunit alpha
MAALISTIDDADKINHYIMNCKEMNIDRLPPDVNKSRMGFTVEDGKIRFGLAAVKNVGRPFIESLLAERDANGAFKNFSDFVERMTNADINKRAVEGLIYCGAFDSMNVFRSQLMQIYEAAMQGAADRHRSNIAGQMSLFDEAEEAEELELPNIPEFDKRELLRLEKQSTGIYFSGHPMEEYEKGIKRIAPNNTAQINESVTKNENGEYVNTNDGLKDGDSIVLGCIIESRKNKITRSKSQMAFLSLEDSFGAIEAIVFPKVLAKYSSLLTEGAVILAKGTLSIREDEEPKLLLNSAEPLEEVLKTEKKERVLYIRLESEYDDTFERVRSALAPFSGNIEVRLFFMDTKRVVRVPESLYFNGSAYGIKELELEFGDGNVAYKD